ncbi:MAG: Fe-S protein assembly co-chaperone HscB [Rhodocyclaceae bacterium]|nr:Fe-S protein assembly co-chaperone HscB [Rhodocyclaceae bacterium]
MAEDFKADFFGLFGLPRAFDIGSDLDQRYLRLQSAMHPDRHVQAGDAARRLALQWATRLNEAYGTLRDPLRRARYLLELRGVSIDEPGTRVASEFLAEQMAWREAIEVAREAADMPELERLLGNLRRERSARLERLGALLDQETGDAEAAEQVRQLMFFDKLERSIDDALAALEG